ncbi:hypothetical protein JCM10449v2_007751 [Rhodotorula kratochvilovae]
MHDPDDPKPAPKKRGRKQDDSLPPSRSRDIQRAFRARRAALLANLEARVLFLEAETAALRLRCGLAPDAPPISGPEPQLTAVESATGEWEVPGGPGTLGPPAHGQARGDGPPARKRTASVVAAPDGSERASRRSSAASAAGSGSHSSPGPSAWGTAMDPQVGAAAEALLSGLGGGASAGAGALPRPPSASSGGGAAHSPATGYAHSFPSPGTAAPYLPPILHPNGHGAAQAAGSFPPPSSHSLSPALGGAHWTPQFPYPQQHQHSPYGPAALPSPLSQSQNPPHPHPHPQGWPPLAHAGGAPSLPPPPPGALYAQQQQLQHGAGGAFFPLPLPLPLPPPLPAAYPPLAPHAQAEEDDAAAQARLRDAEKDLADLAAHQRAFLLRACGRPSPPEGVQDAAARERKWDAFCKGVVEGVLRAEAEGRVASLARRRGDDAGAEGEDKALEKEGEGEGCCEGKVRCAAPAPAPAPAEEDKVAKGEAAGECCGGLIDCSGPLFDDTPSFPSLPSASSAPGHPARDAHAAAAAAVPSYLPLPAAFALLEPFMADPASPPSAGEGVSPSKLATMLWDGYPSLPWRAPPGPVPGPLPPPPPPAKEADPDPPHFAIAGAELRVWRVCVEMTARAVAVRELVIRGVCGEEEAKRRVLGGEGAGAREGGAGGARC